MRPEILFPLFADVDTLKGVGARVRPALLKVAGPLVRDLVFTLPQGLIRRSRTPVGGAIDGQVQIFDLTIDQHIPSRKPGQPYKVRGFDDTGWVHLVYFKTYGDSLLKALPVGARRIVSGKVERFGSEVQIPHPDYVLPLERAGEIPEIEAVYPATAGLSSRQVRKLVHEAMGQAPHMPNWLDPAWKDRKGWAGWHTSLTQAHGPQNEIDLDLTSPARQRLAYDELLAHQLALAQRKRARRKLEAPVLRAGGLSKTLEDALPFALTGRSEERRVGKECRLLCRSRWSPYH